MKLKKVGGKKRRKKEGGPENKMEVEKRDGDEG